MRTGENGRVAILWEQTEIDGLEAAPRSFLCVGAAWSWRGQARFLVDPYELAQERSGDAQGCGTRTLGPAISFPSDTEASIGTLVLTNGAQKFTAKLFPTAGDAIPTLVFEDGCPARDQEFWISAFTETERQSGEAAGMDDTIVAFPAKPQVEEETSDPGRRFVASGGHRVD